MSSRGTPRVFTIPPGAPFLPALAETLLDGRLIPDFRPGSDPLALADVTIYVPTRRAARELRSIFVERAGGASAILPLIRPLGEFYEDGAAFFATGADALDMLPPISAIERLLLLAPLVQRWKRNLPAHVAARFAEEFVVPASAADSIWLARDLAALIDEVETEGSDWAKLAGLVGGDLAGWWQVTLDFLAIITEHWPSILAGLQRSNPAANRNALIRLEAERLRARPPSGPVIAAGSTGSIPATAELLSVVARLPRGALVLPGLDTWMDEESWLALNHEAPPPPILGHPQFGLAKLLRRIGVQRQEAEPLTQAASPLHVRQRVVSEAFRPADTTDVWVERRAEYTGDDMRNAFATVTLIEAANERDEAMAVAIALRQAVETPGHHAALVTGDRDLARRVSAELLRFGIRADDSGGTPLAGMPPAALMTLMLSVVFDPGDPVPLLALLKHPLLQLGKPRATVRRAVEVIELVALRGGYGRPEITTLQSLFDERLVAFDADRPPFWYKRLSRSEIEDARAVLVALAGALAPLTALIGREDVQLGSIARDSVVVLENLVRGSDGGLDKLYDGDAGEKLAEFLRGLVSAEAAFAFASREWPAVFEALISPEVVKPRQGSDARVSIWGALEARLLSPDTLIVGGLNEGVWPRKAVSDRFMSRIMKTGIDLEPPERRVGQSAHDLEMALGVENLILTRASRAGDAPAVASRWLQRMLTFIGPQHTARMRARGAQFLAWARSIDQRSGTPLAGRPSPTPPVDVRPKHFSVTEIETLRRDPYAIYARRILGLRPIDPLVRDPGAAERGTLFHEILHRFSAEGVDPASPQALAALLAAGRECFGELALPEDVCAVWWPRFARLAPAILDWEINRPNIIVQRRSEARAERTQIARTGVTLSAHADRIDVLADGRADIIDYKTGTSPSKMQAHRLIAPQLALEAALLMRGAFAEVGRLEPADLAYIRLKAKGEVLPESILEVKGSRRTASDLAADSWSRLERLIDFYAMPLAGYRSRALPFRETDTDGDYDHLARVLEWSAGALEGEAEE